MSYKLRDADLVEKIEKDLEEEEKLRSQFEQESRDAKVQKRKGFIRRLQLECREAGLDGVVLKAQEVANLQSKEIEQEEKLAAELSFIRQKEIKDEKMRQLLRENSHELRELESQLKAAYANKVLAAQIAENEARKIQEKMFEERVRRVMLNALGSAEEVEKRAMTVEKEMKEEYRRTLQDQIIEKERIRQEEYMAFIKEKKLFEDTIKKVKDEEEKEKVEKLLVKQKIKEEMEQFYKAREIWKARERILIERENQKLEELVKEKEKLERERSQRKRGANTEERDRMIEKMTTEIIAQKKLQEERLDMLRSLKEAECEEMERARMREDLEKELTRRREGRTEFQKLLTEKERRLREERELDARFAEQMNLKVKEEEVKEKERLENKRRNMVNDRIYNERKIIENIQNHAENLKLVQMSTECETEERKREEMIEEERIRILREHAPHLLGYLPKGCLKEKDLEILGITGNSPQPKGGPFMQDIGMGKGKRLHLEEVRKIKAYLSEGNKARKIAKKIGRSHQNVFRYVQDILQYGENHVALSARQVPTSVGTVQRIIKACPVIKRQKIKRKPALKVQRLKSAKLHMSLSKEWLDFIFTDEKKSDFDGPDGSCFHFHCLRKNELIMNKRRNDCGTVINIWGVISYKAALDLVFSEGKRNSDNASMDDIKKIGGTNWTRLAQDRELWRKRKEMFIEDMEVVEEAEHDNKRQNTHYLVCSGTY